MRGLAESREALFFATLTSHDPPFSDRDLERRHRRRRLSRRGGFGSLGTFPRRATSPPLQRRIECHRQQAADSVIFIGLDGADWSLLDQYIARGAMPTLARLVEGGRERQAHDDSSTAISPDLDDDAHGGQPARTPHPRLSAGESRQRKARADHQRRTAKPCGVEHGDVCRKAVRHARILGDLSRRGRRRLDRRPTASSRSCTQKRLPLPAS